MKKILLTEDELLISGLIEFRLNKEGHKTILVKNANKGIMQLTPKNLI